MIALRDLVVTDAAGAKTPAFPSTAFDSFKTLANGDGGAVAGTSIRIALRPEAEKLENWFITGLRIDPGAPGLTPEIVGQFGQQPQIRLIAQPVVPQGGKLQVLDNAAHILFDFSAGRDKPVHEGCLPQVKPDMAAFGKVLADFAELRTKLENGAFGGQKVVTAGLPLGIHPGLADARSRTGFRDALKAVLERHVSVGRLNAMAVMALPGGDPEPWVFLSMVRLPTGNFVPVPSPAYDGTVRGVALSKLSGRLEVVPKPAPNNLNPTTCLNGASRPPLPLPERKGESTATLFNVPPPAAEKAREIIGLIADPVRSHFFNTDCVSCHTETRRAMALKLPIRGVDPKVLPKEDWNVRNFGWFQRFAGQAVQETVTRRTAAETEDLLAFIQKNKLLGEAAAPSPK